MHWYYHFLLLLFYFYPFILFTYTFPAYPASIDISQKYQKKLLIHFYQNKIQNYIQNMIQRKAILSFSVAIFNKKKILYQYHANSNPYQLYQTASVTKLITATLAQIFFQKKILKPSDKLTSYFPDLNVSPWMEEITLEHLITHTAGFPDLRYFKHPEMIRYKDFKFKIPFAIYPPGTHYRYSNHGYMLLGKIIEKKCKMTLEKCARKYIYQPVGMNLSKGPKNGAGGFRTNIYDLIRFGQMYLNFGSYNQKEILSFLSITEMWVPGFYIPPGASQFYTGRGWRIKYNPYMFTMFHIGGANYISAWLQLFPFDGYGLVYLGSPPHYTNRVMNFLYSMQNLLAHLTSVYANRDISMVIWNSPKPTKLLWKQFPGIYQNIFTKEKIQIQIPKTNNFHHKIILRFISRKNSYFLFPETHHIFRGGKDFLTHHFIIDPETNQVTAIANANGFYQKLTLEKKHKNTQ